MEGHCLHPLKNNCTPLTTQVNTYLQIIAKYMIIIGI